MKPVLIIEIASALVALGALATLVIQAVRAKLKSGGDSVGLGRGHVAIGRVLLAASSVHGLAAMAYGSGARPEAYALGWASLALFALSGACMHPSVKCRLNSPVTAHATLFAMGIVLFIMHAVAGRL
ncbi:MULTISPECIES: hypothetical protein [Collinsella]|uniref:hypothetical protein n=1 Tax=Collinsella TaxID=102106 RepID=UPI00257EFBA0|nr:MULTISPECIES: hypothetical protein [Collinsella]